MKGMIDHVKHPVAHSAFSYLIGSSVGWFIGAVTLFFFNIDPIFNMALSTTFMVTATLIALTWGEK